MSLSAQLASTLRKSYKIKSTPIDKVWCGIYPRFSLGNFAQIYGDSEFGSTRRFSAAPEHSTGGDSPRVPAAAVGSMVAAVPPTHAAGRRSGRTVRAHGRVTSDMSSVDVRGAACARSERVRDKKGDSDRFYLTGQPYIMIDDEYSTSL